MILRVGLTGGIASGKSSVARILRELGCFVVDADQIVRELYVPGGEGHRTLVERYGSDVLTDEGEIDRRKLSALALTTAEGAEVLNALIHPLVIDRQQQILAEVESGGSDTIAVVEATLLIESGGRARFDKIVVVDADPDTQVKRAVSRGVKREEAELRIARQLQRQERLKVADYVIDNNGDEDELRANVSATHSLLQRDLKRKKEMA